jgi:hypothetical protein
MSEQPTVSALLYTVIIKYEVDNKKFSSPIIPDAELEIQNDSGYAQNEHSCGS